MSRKLSLDDFLLSMKLAPRLAIELLIENSKSELLLEMREGEPFKGMWHIPGGFLLKDEKISEAISRLANEELKLDLSPDTFEFMGIFETIGEDPRGHIVHYVVRHKEKIDSVNIQGVEFFAKIPQGTISYQINLLKKLGYSTSNQSIGE